MMSVQHLLQHRGTEGRMLSGQKDTSVGAIAMTCAEQAGQRDRRLAAARAGAVGVKVGGQFL